MAAPRAWNFRYHGLLQWERASDGVGASGDQSHKTGELRLSMYMSEIQVFKNNYPNHDVSTKVVLRLSLRHLM